MAASWRVIAAVVLGGAVLRGEPGGGWPEVTRECRPWAYNWWLGSAVDRENLSRELRRYRDAGLGGVHVIPIYGAKGAEARYLPYLGEDWKVMVRFAIEEAGRIGLGVDMTTGSGWCFGGPDISREMGCLAASVAATNAAPGFRNPGDNVAKGLRPSGRDSEIAPRSEVAVRQTGRKVKRAAPGGEGLMLNPFSPSSMRAYLDGFGRRFPAAASSGMRAMYHDSFEYDGGWAPEVFEAFERRRGYRLQDRLGDVAPGAEAETTCRVLADYRETLSDLMIEEVFPQWIRWCAARGLLTRNQAHGSPANLLDLYALADVPETEMFGRGERDPLASGFDGRFGEGDRDPLVSKFASSAAHVAGRRLVSAEYGTWMAEHFCETLEELKCLADLLFACGVNHLIYHGCCYSPDDAAWPGWMFYASTQMNPRNPIWRDAGALNTYIARAQSVLQSGAPDNDILLYWPIHDLWHAPARKPGAFETIQCTVHERSWLDGQPVGAAARLLWRKGWGFDYVSDRQLAGAGTAGGGIALPGGGYRAVVVPTVTHMPPAAFDKLMSLAKGGATIVFQGDLPRDVPGGFDVENRRAAIRKAGDALRFEARESGVRIASLGRGRILTGDLEAALAAAGVAREALCDNPGMLLVRRRHEGGRDYFLANQGTGAFDAWWRPARGAKSAIIMDPMTGRTGAAPARGAGGNREFRIRLEPGASVLVRTFEDREAEGDAWRWTEAASGGMPIAGPWRVEFIAGGPALPRMCEARELKSWTVLGDPAAECFAGTAVYRAQFDAPGEGPWMLDLGRVCHSARVRVNGTECGVVFMKPYRLALSNLKPSGNLLEVEVTNLAANRIRDLDRRKVPWRVFHDANVVNIRYKPFDASGWPLLDSGLLGPVTLAPARTVSAAD